jgi:hypothetical protein
MNDKKADLAGPEISNYDEINKILPTGKNMVWEKSNQSDKYYRLSKR